MPAFNIGIVAGASIKTLNPDGSVYKDISSDATKNRIGEYKKWTQNFEVSGGNDLDSKMIAFSPELFLTASRISYNPGQIPTECFSYLNDSSSTPGTYQMYLNVNSPYASDLIKNWEAWITIIDSVSFSIELYYYQVYDLGDYLNSSIENNADKLLKSHVNETSQLVTTVNSVYTTSGIIPISYIIVYDTSDTSTYASTITNYNGYGAGFYNKNVYGASPFFSNPVWELYDSTPTQITQLLTGQNTKVKFTIDTGGSTIDRVLMWAIRTDTSDNSVNFYDNYEASFIEITTAGSGTLDNKIIAPSQAISLVSGNTYDCFFHLDKSLIAIGQTYRFIAVVYLEEYGIYNVNSFISDEYTVELPKFDGDLYAFEASLTDYLNEYTGNDLTCVIEERLKSTIVLDYAYNVFKADILARLGITLTDNDIRRYLTKITFEIYEEIGNTIHYLQRDTCLKTSPTTYSTPSNCSLSFAGEILTAEFSFRNRYESNVANIETTVSGIPLTTPTSNQYWGGRTLKIKTSLTLYYDDYSTPFTDVIEYDQQITVKDYEYSDLYIQNQNGLAIPAFYLDSSNPDLEGVLGLSSPEGYKLITTGEISPGTISTIEENEVFTGELPQLTSTKFTDQDENYSDSSATKGYFTLDVNNFLLNLSYKISCLAKKESIIPATARITEDSVLRDLEITDFRITE